ncbi:hypothetical protein B0H17DRAFT_1143302 [Mycena rosella]|uniref:Uncharacterized protein n=1 Tax=Mycena rosella TaxID=1033263 RepID=A0AAD7CVX8_MYCRO|nr:hypothetical protein B0H17DRAFT_1143302 [Mycena rosella]
MMEKMMFVPLLDMSRSDKIYDLMGLKIQRCPGQRRRKAIFKSTYGTGGYNGAESKECTVRAVASQMDGWLVCDQPCAQDDLVFFKGHIVEEPIPRAGHVIVVPRPIKTGVVLSRPFAGSHPGGILEIFACADPSSKIVKSPKSRVPRNQSAMTDGRDEDRQKSRFASVDCRLAEGSLRLSSDPTLNFELNLCDKLSEHKSGRKRSRLGLQVGGV